MFDKSHFYYVKDEVGYGCYLFYSGWKKLLFHPWQTVKDTAYAAYHPLETGSILLSQVRQHPIGIAVNIGLSWTTGRVISTGVEYLENLEYFAAEVEASSNLAALSSVQNATTPVGGSLIPSALSQAVQASSQLLSGSCCGGVCTISRIGGQTTILTSQPASSAGHQKPQPNENVEKQKQSSSFLSYFWKTSSNNKACNDACSKTKSCSDDPNYQLQPKML